MSNDHVSVQAPADSRTLSIDRLRGAVTLLVLAHHAVLAYHPYAPPPAASLAAPPRLWPAFPVVDTQRWAGIDVFVGFNEGFFMSLMFLIAGVFVWSSLVRKGAIGFLKDRALRLGVPFLVAGAVIAPLAYYPSYLQMGGADGISGFLREWLALGAWYSGPAWFLWVLLAFSGLAALAYRLIPHWGEWLGRTLAAAGEKPIAFLLLLVLASALTYLPMAHLFGPMEWSQVGPFSVQTSRIAHYAIYFFVGAAIGAHGVDRGLLARDGRLARRWPLWWFFALLSFAVSIAVLLAILSAMSKGDPGIALLTLGNLCYVVTCATSSLAFIAVFVRYSRKRGPLTTVLSDNAYGMYLTHYPIVSWLQFALLGAAISGALKGSIVIAGAVLFSLIVTAALRRIPAVARVI